MRKKLIVIGLFLFAIFGAKMTCNAAEILQQVNFNGGVSLPWNVSESNEMNSYSKVVDGAYMVHIDQAGTNTWDVQIRHKEFVIQSGHTYNVSFKVKAQKPMKVRAKIGDADDKRNWKEYWFKEVNVTTEYQTVTGSFNADSSYTIVEFAMHFGGPNAQNLPNEIFFDDCSLQDSQFKATATPVPTPERLIRVNQLGYYPEAAKKATLVSSSTSGVAVQLKSSSGTVIWSGTSKPMGKDIASGENVHIIDFSAAKTEGKNYQLSAGTATSLPFDIGKDMYSKLKYDSLRYFYHARSGIAIEMPYCVDSKWARPAGHTSDTATLFVGRDYYTDGVKTAYTGGPSSLNGTGGWYDAGDHGKYVVNGGISTWTVQNQYEWAKSKGITAYENNTMNIPESSNSYPDLLDESRWNVEYFLKVQIPAGSNKAGMVIHKLADENWTALGLRPDQDTQKRFFYPPSTAATLNFAAVTAQAGRLWEQLDPTFADKCIKAAEVAWKAALANPNITAPYGQETGSGSYGDDNPKDEFYWAACELFVTTGKAEYLTYLKGTTYALKVPTTLSGESNGTPGSMDWGNTAACGTIDLVLNAERSIKNGMTAAEIQSARTSMGAAADTYLSVQATEGYGVPLKVSTYVNEFGGQKETIENGYPWGSNSFVVNQAMIMAYAYDFTGNVKYVNGCTEAMDYIMGRNPMLQCYVTGYGENPLKYPHHRFFCPQIDPSFPSAPPGFLSGGPNSGCQDPWASGAGLKANKAPAQKCFLDHVESWSTNEVTINWNAPLAWLTGYLDYTGPIIGKVVVSPDPSTGPSDPGKKSLDVNDDGAINMSDVMEVASAFNSSFGDGKYVAKYDLNSDDAVNMQDIMMIAAKFNTLAY